MTLPLISGLIFSFEKPMSKIQHDKLIVAADVLYCKQLYNIMLNLDKYMCIMRIHITLKKFHLMCLFVILQQTSELMVLFLQVDPESIIAGKAAIGNLLGGIGYFFGQSKIALPRDVNVSH